MSHVEVAIFRFVRPLIAVVVTLVVGEIGYVVIEGLSVSHALYWSLPRWVPLAPREVRPLSAAGLAFSVVRIMVGVATVYYLFGASRGVRSPARRLCPFYPLPDEDDDVIDDPFRELPDQIDHNRLGDANPPQPGGGRRAP